MFSANTAFYAYRGFMEVLRDCRVSRAKVGELVHKEVKLRACMGPEHGHQGDRGSAPRVTKAKGPASCRGPCFVEGYVRPSTQGVDYLLPLFLAALSSLPAPALPWPAGLRASPFLEPVLIPVVVPDFILLDFIL
jgi:hypothetical protein